MGSAVTEGAGGKWRRDGPGPCSKSSDNPGAEKAAPEEAAPGVLAPAPTPHPGEGGSAGGRDAEESRWRACPRAETRGRGSPGSRVLGGEFGKCREQERGPPPPPSSLGETEVGTERQGETGAATRLPRPVRPPALGKGPVAPSSAAAPHPVPPVLCRGGGSTASAEEAGKFQRPRKSGRGRRGATFAQRSSLRAGPGSLRGGGKGS